MIYKKALGEQGTIANHVFAISSIVSTFIVFLFTFLFFGEINPWKKLLFCALVSTLLSGISTGITLLYFILREGDLGLIAIKGPVQ